MANKLLLEVLKLNGTGTVNMAGVYSAESPGEFKYTATQLVVIWRMLAIVTDNAGFGALDYGAIASGLTNGCQFYTTDANGVVHSNFTDVVAIQTNSDWAGLAYDAETKNFDSGSTKSLVCRYTFANHGKPLELLPGWSFIFKVRDDLSSLVAQRVKIEGYVV